MTEFSEIKRLLLSKGSWLVVIRPLKFKERMGVSECKQMLERCQVSVGLRLYPYYNPEGYQRITIGPDYAESVANFKSKIEFCRLYQSGMFAHTFACQEDIWDATKDRHVLEVLNTLYKITEIYQFASNLALNDVLDYDVKIMIDLYHMKGRTLTFLNPERELNHPYECHFNPIKFAQEYTKSKIVGSSSKYAIKTTEEILRRFNWLSDDLENLLVTEQEAFLKDKSKVFP